MTNDDKPYSPACDRNREPILAILKRVLPNKGMLLEIGSGTGQHAVYFAPEFPKLIWQTSDLMENHAGIQAWLEECPSDNLRQPELLDVTQAIWPVEAADAVFSANTAHIMPWPVTRQMIAGAGRILKPGGVFALYGPFNYGGEFTSESNRSFDASLKSRDPAMGIRDVEKVVKDAEAACLSLSEDNEMPANNRLLVFETM